MKLTLSGRSIRQQKPKILDDRSDWGVRLQVSLFLYAVIFRWSYSFYYYYRKSCKRTVECSSSSSNGYKMQICSSIGRWDQKSGPAKGYSLSLCNGGRPHTQSH